MPKDFQVTLGWGKLGALSWDSPKGSSAILAFHGWLDNAASFEPLAPLFTQSGYSFTALELAGHGSSAHRLGSAYHFIDYVLDTLEAIESMPTPLTLMGHSLGGAVAAFVAALRPECCARLVLLESSGPLHLTPESLPSRLLQHYAKRLSASTPPKSISLEVATRARMQVGKLSEKNAKRLVLRNLVPAEGGYRWRSDPALRLPSAFRLSQEQIKPFLNKITCPTLVVQARDGMAPTRKEYWDQNLSQIPGAERVWVQGGHHAHMESPQEVFEAVTTWSAWNS